MGQSKKQKDGVSWRLFDKEGRLTSVTIGGGRAKKQKGGLNFTLHGKKLRTV